MIAIIGQRLATTSFPLAPAKSWDLSHSSLGPAIPHASAVLPVAGLYRHEISGDDRVVAMSVLGGLHHECIMNIGWRRWQLENGIA